MCIFLKESTAFIKFAKVCCPKKVTMLSRLQTATWPLNLTVITQGFISSNLLDTIYYPSLHPETPPLHRIYVTGVIYQLMVTISVTSLISFFFLPHVSEHFPKPVILQVWSPDHGNTWELVKYAKGSSPASYLNQKLQGWYYFFLSFFDFPFRVKGGCRRERRRKGDGYFWHPPAPISKLARITGACNYTLNVQVDTGTKSTSLVKVVPPVHQHGP